MIDLPLTESAEAVAEAPERRSTARFLCEVRAAAEAPDGPACEARVRDVTTSGVGLVAGHHFEPGSPVVVTLRRPEGGAATVLPAEVVYSVPFNADEWMLGCVFARPLRGTELRRLLADAAGYAAPSRVPMS